jgi:hypothetical protein
MFERKTHGTTTLTLAQQPAIIAGDVVQVTHQFERKRWTLWRVSLVLYAICTEQQRVIAVEDGITMTVDFLRHKIQWRVRWEWSR